MRTWLSALVGAALLGGCMTTPGRGARAGGEVVATGFLNKTMAVNGRERPYVVYVPREYDPRTAWPLIVFLHGIGERGDDGLAQTEVGIGRAIRLGAERFPCLVVMPQCPEDVYWDGAVDAIDQALALTRAEYHVDPARIYLTGLSLGGYGTWIYGARRTEVYAALLPICGGGNVADAARLAAVPIWAFHGADDEKVLPEKSREMVEAVRRAGGKVRYTEYPDTGHNAWDAAYGDRKAVKWLLRQRKR